MDYTDIDVKVALGNGKELECHLNGNTFESDTKVTEDTFKDGLDSVSYTTADGEVTNLGGCSLIIMEAKSNGKYAFSLTPLTAEEKAAKATEQRISDLEDMIADIAGGAE